MCEKTMSLSDEDKQGIKQAILKAVENGNTDPENLVYRLIYSLERVNNFDARRSSGFASFQGVDDGGNAISSKC